MIQVSMKQLKVGDVLFVKGHKYRGTESVDEDALYKATVIASRIDEEDDDNEPYAVAVEFVDPFCGYSDRFAGVRSANGWWLESCETFFMEPKTVRGAIEHYLLNGGELCLP